MIKPNPSLIVTLHLRYTLYHVNVFFLSLGDEMGMLEDVCVSISNLTCVKFKVTCQLCSCRCISARLL